jgi:hypothetical protein
MSLPGRRRGGGDTVAHAIEDARVPPRAIYRACADKLPATGWIRP